MRFSPQIPLQLEPRRPDRFEDFVAGPNEGVLAAVQALLEEPGSTLFLSGPDGAGKSHLLNASCHSARERGYGAFYVALRRLPQQAAASLQGLQALDLVCVDDIDSVVGDRVWEEALFACFNAVRAASGRLLISSNRPLSQLDFALPDLASRLAWGVRQKLRSPDDDDKLRILAQQANSLGIDVPMDVQTYLLKHGKRDMSSLLGTLEQLKHVAFAEKRKITIPMARSILRADRVPTI